MARRRVTDGETSSPYKRGLVREVDAGRGRARVEFADEDGVVSFWLNVNQASVGKVSISAMPSVGSQVNCLVDWRGEDGAVIGGVHSEGDPSPLGNADEVRIVSDGLDVTINTATGAVSVASQGAITIESAGEVRIKAATIVLEGDVHLGGRGGAPVHRMGDADSAGDIAEEAASRVFAV